jgi:hypothetical protein
MAYIGEQLSEVCAAFNDEFDYEFNDGKNHLEQEQIHGMLLILRDLALATGYNPPTKDPKSGTTEPICPNTSGSDGL